MRSTRADASVCCKREEERQSRAWLSWLSADAVSRQVERPPAREADGPRQTDEVASLTRARVGELILEQALAEFARRGGDILPVAEADAPVGPDILPAQEADAPRRRGRRRARP